MILLNETTYDQLDDIDITLTNGTIVHIFKDSGNLYLGLKTNINNDISIEVCH